MFEASRRSREWVRRRDERAELIDNRTLRRTVTIELNDSDVPCLDSYVPLGLVDYSPVAARVVTDGSGRRLSVLNDIEENRLVSLALARWSACPSRNRVGRLGIDDRASHLSEIRSLLETGVLNPLAGESFGFRPGTLKADLFDSVADLITPMARRRMTVARVEHGRPDLVVLVQNDAASFPLVPLLRPRNRTHESSFSFPYFEDFLRRVAGSLPDPGSSRWGRQVERRLDLPGQWLRRIDDLTIKVPLLDPAAAQSTHLDVVAPDGTFISESVMILAGSEGPDKPYVVRFGDDDSSHSSSRFHVPSKAIPDGSHVHEAAAAVVVRPMYWGHLRPAWLVSVLSLALLSAVAFLGVFPRAGWYGLSSESLETDSTVSILLLAPSLFLASLIRRNENHFAGIVLWELRLRLGVLLVGLLSAAMLLALVKPNDPVAACFVVILLTGGLSTWMTSRSAWASRTATAREVPA